MTMTIKTTMMMTASTISSMKMIWSASERKPNCADYFSLTWPLALLYHHYHRRHLSKAYQVWIGSCRMIIRINPTPAFSMIMALVSVLVVVVEVDVLHSPQH